MSISVLRDQTAPRIGRKKRRGKNNDKKKPSKESAVGRIESVLCGSLSKVADSCSTQAGTPVCFSRHLHSVFTISVFLMRRNCVGVGGGNWRWVVGVGSEHLNTAVIYLWFHEDVVPLTQNQ